MAEAKHVHEQTNTTPMCSYSGCTRPGAYTSPFDGWGGTARPRRVCINHWIDEADELVSAAIEHERRGEWFGTVPR